MNLLIVIALFYNIRALRTKGEKVLDHTTLICTCQQGDLESFEQLYRQYNKKAMGTAYLIAKNKGIAEDIVQEAFFQCYKEIKGLKNAAAFDVWFYKLLIRLAWKMSSKSSNMVPIDTIELQPSFDGTETRLELYEAIDNLSLPLKTVIILYYFNDMSIKEIAAILGCLQGTVKSRLHNAKRLIKKELGEADNDDFSLKYMAGGTR